MSKVTVKVGETIQGLDDGETYIGLVTDMTDDGRQIEIEDEVTATRFWIDSSTVEVVLWGADEA